MKTYIQAYLAMGIFISVIGAQLMLVGITTINIPQIVITGAFLSLWWFAYSSLKKEKRNSFIFSYVIACVPFCYEIILILQERLFAIRHNGIERTAAYDSPLALLVDRVFEAFMFFIFSIVVRRGLTVILENRRQRQSDAVESLEMTQ